VKRYSQRILGEAQTMKTLSNLFRDETGVTVIEYGVIACLVGLMIVTATTVIGGNLKTTFTTVAIAL
jgi:pilus assembly protein Flp/PilA